MHYKVAMIMDPISQINTKKDTSFALLLEIQRRQHDIYYLEYQDFYFLEDKVYCRAKRLSVEDNHVDWYQLEKEKTVTIDFFDVIFMRKDPPVNASFIYTTFFLDHAMKNNVLVVNTPFQLRNYNEKFSISFFPELSAKTLITCNYHDIEVFFYRYKDIIIKPLDGMGGASIFRIKEDKLNLPVIFETVSHHGSEFIMVQEYLPEIKHGDKRLFLIDGEVYPYCLARLPQSGETRGNLAAGGQGIAQIVNKEDHNIAQIVATKMKQEGILFIGLDMIGNKITEINLTSPTCIRQVEETFNVNICELIIDAVEKKYQKMII